jgi:hypothetical protein
MTMSTGTIFCHGGREWRRVVRFAERAIALAVTVWQRVRHPTGFFARVAIRG